MPCSFPMVIGAPTASVEMQHGDLLPILILQLLGDAKTPVDLSTATSVFFWMTHQGTGIEVGGEMSIVAPLLGKCSYTWSMGDTDLSGMYIGRVEVTFVGDKKMTFPTCPEKGGLLIGICD